MSIKLPALQTHLANARHGRYVLPGHVSFAHRSAEWAERVEQDRAVAYLPVGRTALAGTAVQQES